MFDPKCLTRTICRIALIATIPMFAACGGEEGEEGGNPTNQGTGSDVPTVRIGSPVQSGLTFTTDLDSVEIRGTTSFKFADVDCSLGFGFVGDQSVSVRNETTGVGGTALPRVNCSLPIASMWIMPAGILMLEMGSNQITASLNGGDKETITIVREADNLPPEVVSKTPYTGSTGFPISGDSVRVEFSDDMEIATMNNTNFTLEDPSGVVVPAVVAYSSSSRTASLRVSEPLDYLTTYTARVSTAVTDSDGNAMRSDVSWYFTTASNPDVWPPTIVEAFPEEDNACAAPDQSVSVRFSETLAPDSVSESTVILTDSNGTTLPGVVTVDDTVVDFEPDAALGNLETYTVTVSDGVTDLAGNAFVQRSWDITTERAPEGFWSPIAIPTMVEGRAQHSAVWTGNQMIVWGGYARGEYLDRLAEGHGRYDPLLDQWSTVSTVGAPEARRAHTAVWTGSEMIVWGGATNGQPSGGYVTTSSGGRYNPTTDTWLPMTFTGAPTPRALHSATWTGTEMIIWGGAVVTGSGPGTGARYNPATDTWTTMSTVNAPSNRGQHHAVFDGQRLIVWGGRTNVGIVSDGAMYDPTTDSWSELPTQGAPDSARSGLHAASVVWTGTEMLVRSPEKIWDYDQYADEWFSTFQSESARFDPQAQLWSPMPDACDAGEMPNAVWSSNRMIAWNADLSEGQIYSDSLDAWLPVTAFPGEYAEMSSVVVTDGAVIVWGGKTGYSTHTNLGYRLTF